MISRWLSAPRTVAAALLFHAMLISGSVADPGRAVAAAAISWRVENPFRFFTDPSDTEVHRATYLSLRSEQRAAPVLSAEHLLQSREADGWAASMFRKTCWNDNRFKCDTYDDYINPASLAVVARITGIEDAAALSCTWLTAPRDPDSPRGEAVTQPCSETARFLVPYPGGTVITVEIGGREVAKEDVKVRDILVAGMGDSFASGEGNPDLAVRFSRERTADYSTPGFYSGLTGYPARIGPWREFGDKTFLKENARWLDQACHRSLYSEQLRTALELAVEDPHRAVTFVGVSCAGAEVTDGLFLRYKGNEWVPNPPRLSQISALAEAQCGNHKTEKLDVPEAYHADGQIPELKGGLVLRKCPQDYARKIDLVLLSIGGNDIGFSRLLANAVLSDESLLRELGGWLGEVHGEAEASSELDHLGVRYKSLNRAIHNILYVPWEESDRIVLVSYPGLALEGDGSKTCRDGHAGMDVVPDFELNETKLKLGTWFGDKLHRQMRESAYEHGWTFVETHRRAFIGRGICAGLAVEGVGEVDDLRLPRNVNGVWTPYNPADYQPYASRQRWFRTPNDAFMTGNFHAEAGLLTKLLKFEPFAPFQLVLASTYSGAFHPTAEGQAAIADAVVDKARAVLAKYGEGPDVAPGYAPVSSDDAPPAPVAEPGRDVPDVKSALTATTTAPPAATAGAATPVPPTVPAIAAGGPAAAAPVVAAPVGTTSAPLPSPVPSVDTPFTSTVKASSDTPPPTVTPPESNPPPVTGALPENSDEPATAFKPFAKPASPPSADGNAPADGTEVH